MKGKWKASDWYTIPNLWDICRILLSRYLRGCICRRKRHRECFTAALVIGLSGLTDLFDGKNCKKIQSGDGAWKISRSCRGQTYPWSDHCLSCHPLPGNMAPCRIVPDQGRLYGSDGHAAAPQKRKKTGRSQMVRKSLHSSFPM